MPRFLEALHFISGRIPNTNKATETPPQSIATDALSTALDIINNHIPSQVKAAISTFLQDKSQSEVLFLASILLAVVLFVVILPVAEALFGIDSIDSNDAQGSRSSSIEQHSSSPSKMKMYKPGVGVVEVDAAEVTSETTLRRGSSNGSRCGSILSGGSMETIEESEEEDEVGSEDDDDLSSMEDDDTQRQRHVHVHVTPTKIVRFKQDQQEVVSPLPPPKDLIFATTGRSESSVADKTKYYEFLHFINSENDSPLGGQGDGQRKKVSFDTTRGDQQVLVKQQEGGEIVNGDNPFAELLALRNTKEDNNKSHKHPSSPTQEVHLLSQGGYDDDDGDEVSSLESPIPSPPPSPYMEERTKLSMKCKSSKSESFKHKLSYYTLKQEI